MRIKRRIDLYGSDVQTLYLPDLTATSDPHWPKSISYSSMDSLCLDTRGGNRYSPHPKPEVLITATTETKIMAKKIKSVALAEKKKSKPKKEDFQSAFLKGLYLRKQDLLQTLDHLMKSRKEYEGQLTAGDFIEEVDGAQREISAYSQFTLIERKNRELQKIEYLLNRVAQDQGFGICEECGTRIPKERLLLVPEANLCVECQRELETMDSWMSPASHSPDFGPTGREVSWVATEPSEEEDGGALVEYDINTLPNGDIDESDTGIPPKERKEAKDS